MKRLKNLIVAAVLFLSSCHPVFASDRTLVAKDRDGSVVTLHDAACLNKVAMKQLPKLNALSGLSLKESDLKAGNLLFRGKMYGICWAVVEPMVAVMDDGDADDSLFPVPMSDFREPEVI